MEKLLSGKMDKYCEGRVFGSIQKLKGNEANNNLQNIGDLIFI